MIGRILCWIAWHEWRYRHEMAGARVGSRVEAQHLENLNYIIRCSRCGERP